MLDGFHHNRLIVVLKWALAIMLVVFLAAPSFIVVPMSFSGSEFLRFPPEELSLRWYRNFADSITWTSATRASAIAATVTTIIAVPVGMLAAYGTLQLGKRMRILVSTLIVLPAIIPAILIAVGMFFVLAKAGFLGTMAGLVLGHVALAIPVVFVVMTAAFSQFDFAQEKAARSLGASPTQAWMKVIVPQMKGPLTVAALLAFVTSLDEVVLSMFVSGGDNATLPKVMFASLRDQIDPTIAVVSTVMLLVATLAVVVVIRRGGQSMLR